ncbi:xylulose 5-phosphate/phosphate translocator [Cucumis melo var. makuwa]|uniref:Xylulose 5-phosphate/phosphate translocator n=1 Tax=Cucumis melo var. makuwa TaxID=1194695 RepID=A0A5A7TLT3_CUCMM|nr:xylulose 5-phosphate/phosphate translocator [Cucumis melo var. makuwa]
MQTLYLWTTRDTVAITEATFNIEGLSGAMIRIFYHLYNQSFYQDLDEISPLTFSVGNTMKRAVVIVASVLVFRNPVRPLNAVGSAIAIFGTFLYSQATSKKSSKKIEEDVDVSCELKLWIDSLITCEEKNGDDERGVVRGDKGVSVAVRGRGVSKFLNSLEDKAKDWLKSLRAESITNVEHLDRKKINHFSRLRRGIRNCCKSSPNMF